MLVLNHGTLNSMIEDENIITVLARALGYPTTAGGSDKIHFESPGGVFVTNGVGSALLDMDLLRLNQQQQGGISKSRQSWTGEATLHPGVVDAGEVKKNVDDYLRALDRYSQRYARLPESMDFVGYSRGAVTCFKMMNQEPMQARKAGWENWRPRYRIFAIDPVPGITNNDNKHMWDEVELTNTRQIDKRTNCFILLSEGERRVTFTPMLPREARVKGNKELVDYDTMPGVHIAMAGSEGHHTTPMFQLIKDMVAWYFGDDYPFQQLRCASSWEKFNLYAEVVNGLQTQGFLRHGRGVADKALFKETHLKHGRKFHVPGQGATPSPTGWMGTGGDKKTLSDVAYQLRSNKLDKRSGSSARGKVRVFVNTAHKKLCQTLLSNQFPHFHQCDKGIWTNASRLALQRSFENPNVMRSEHVYAWVVRLIEEGPWEN